MGKKKDEEVVEVEAPEVEQAGEAETAPEQADEPVIDNEFPGEPVIDNEEPTPAPEPAPDLTATNDQRLPTLAEVNGEEPEAEPTEDDYDGEDE